MSGAVSSRRRAVIVLATVFLCGCGGGATVAQSGTPGPTVHGPTQSAVSSSPGLATAPVTAPGSPAAPGPASTPPSTSTTAHAPTSLPTPAKPPAPGHVTISPSGESCVIAAGNQWNCTAPSPSTFPSWNCNQHFSFEWSCQGSLNSTDNMSWSCGQSQGSPWQCAGYAGANRSSWTCTAQGAATWACSGTTQGPPAVEFSCSTADSGRDWSCGDVAGYPDMTWQPFMQPS